MLSMGIEVHVSTSVNPFKDLYKKCSLGNLYVQCLLSVIVFFEYKCLCSALTVIYYIQAFR